MEADSGYLVRVRCFRSDFRRAKVAATSQAKLPVSIDEPRVGVQLVQRVCKRLQETTFQARVLHFDGGTGDDGPVAPGVERESRRPRGHF